MLVQNPVSASALRAFPAGAISTAVSKPGHRASRRASVRSVPVTALPRSGSRMSTIVFALGDSKGDRPKLTRENEPEEYWTSERERQGKSAFTDPVALIGVLAIFFPIILLLILSALGVVDLTPQ
jgi:hypothetical protein